MTGTLSLKGATGSIRWGYHAAAILRDWSVTPSKEKPWTLRAAIVTHDPIKVAQRPLTFEVQTQAGPWVWPIQSLQISGSSLTAMLGPRETKT